MNICIKMIHHFPRQIRREKNMPILVGLNQNLPCFIWFFLKQPAEGPKGYRTKASSEIKG
jgi:hypothetical protein